MSATMAKKPEEPQTDSLDEVTSVKCFVRFRRAVAQLGSLLDLNQQEVVDRYQEQIEQDLLKEIAKRQAELRRQRPGQG